MGTNNVGSIESPAVVNAAMARLETALKNTKDECKEILRLARAGHPAPTNIAECLQAADLIQNLMMGQPAS